jgi:hypothetical protein
MTQQRLPLPADDITDLDGVPHDQSDPTPPENHPPLLVSKVSLYGNVLIEDTHCPFAACLQAIEQMRSITDLI